MKQGGNKYHSLFIFIVFVFILNLMFARQVFCYDTTVAHPGIAELAVKLYNQNNGQKISVEQLDWIKSGAVDEDEPTRWFNHFYDPIYNRGLYFGKQHDTAKDWAKDPVKQTEYSSGDNSWQRAINDYRKGNKKLAFKELGHNIHLVSDMLVPAHTRDSIHAIPPDSYENYVKNNWDLLSKDVRSELFNKNSLEDVFDEASKYSNGNFYSDNTIESKKYDVLKIVKRDLIESKNGNNYFGNYADIKNNKQLLYLDESKLGWENKISGSNNKMALDSTKDGIVLNSYAAHLIPKAVGYSANTIKLFLAETQKNEKQKLPFFRIGVSGLLNTGVGKIISAAENIYDYARSQTPDDQISSGTDQVSPVKNIESETSPTNNIVKSVAKLAAPQINNPIISLTPVQNINPSNPVINIPALTNNPQPPTYYSGGGLSPTRVVQIVEPIVVGETSATTVEHIVTTTDGAVVVTSTPTSTPVVETTTSTMEINSSTPETLTPTSTTSTIEITTTTITTSTPVDTTTSTVPETIATSTTSTPDTIQTPISSAPDVVINEIAWAGTSASTDQDEYVELYNNTNQDIVLFSSTNTSKWWKLMIGDREVSMSKIINRVIPKNGYYLFERTDDRTVNEIPADIIYSGAIKNSGERLRLFDGNNQIVDEVDCSSTWFAGSAVTYSSMEKINSRLPGNDSQNWQPNQGPRLDGKVDGGGDDIPLNGSPKQSNFGSIVLKSRQIETDRSLKKGDYPYILTYYEIPVGKTLNIDPGVVIKTYYPDSKIEVKGNLNINGASDNKVVLTSGRDENFASEYYKNIIGSRTGAPQTKDWQGLLLYTSSTANLFGLDFRYAGKAFRAPGANMYDSLVSQAIRTDGAVLNINNSIFTDVGDVNIYTNKTNSIIKNTNFKNGQLAIENYDGSLELENIGLENFTNINGPVYVKNIWPKMLQINFTNNTTNNVTVDQAIFASNSTVNKEIPMTWQNITIEPNVTVDISAGTNIKMSEYSNILVKGTLNLNGTEDDSINITPVQPLLNNYWGRIIIEGGKGNFKNSNISGGRGSIGNDGYQGMVTVKNGELNMQNSQLLDSRAPGNTLEIDNSSVGINNSAIGYIGSKPSFDHTDGIKIYSGDLMLNNTNLMNLDTGILSGLADPLPGLLFNNMDSRNFMNVKTLWDPPIWFSGFGSSATSTP